MPESSRKHLFRLIAVLGFGGVIGLIYGQFLAGMLVAALMIVSWHSYRLLAFDRALSTRDFTSFQHGEGIWQRIYSRLAFERDRGRRHKHEYRRLLKEIRKSTDAMPDGAVILSQDNEVVACNRAATELVGLKRKKDRGQRVDNLIRNPKLTSLLHEFDGTASCDLPSPKTDGIWLNCRVVPYGANQKLLLLRDVTDRIALNQIRRDFIANTSHELRSPLTVINGYLESLAERTDIPPDLEKPIREMRDQSRRMTAIIDELLELSRLEASGRADDADSVDVAALLRKCRQEYVDRHSSQRIDIEEMSTVKLLGNAAEIESVIRNLLSNAVRHTEPNGKITLIWHADADGADLICRDTGEGIAEEHIPRLTERFFRVDRGRARDDGGVGLGLAIVKHILGRHDAELTISSTPGAGSEFRCHFPISRVDALPPVPIAGGSQSG